MRPRQRIAPGGPDGQMLRDVVMSAVPAVRAGKAQPTEPDGVGSGCGPPSASPVTSGVDQLPPVDDARRSTVRSLPSVTQTVVLLAESPATTCAEQDGELGGGVAGDGAVAEGDGAAGAAGAVEVRAAQAAVVATRPRASSVVRRRVMPLGRPGRAYRFRESAG